MPVPSKLSAYIIVEMYYSEGMSACSPALEKWRVPHPPPKYYHNKERIPHIPIYLPTYEFPEIMDYVRNQEDYDPATWKRDRFSQIIARYGTFSELEEGWELYERDRSQFIEIEPDE